MIYKLNVSVKLGKSASRKRDQKDIFLRRESHSFNLEQLPTSPWLTTFKINVLFSF